MTTEKISLAIEGMHCEACVRRATAALTRADVGQVSEVRIGKAEVEAPVDAGPALVAALEKAGFAARVTS